MFSVVKSELLCSSTHHQPRSRSSGVTGTTFASRARQREAIGQPLQRSRPASVASRPPTVDRSQSEPQSCLIDPIIIIQVENSVLVTETIQKTVGVPCSTSECGE